MDQGEVRKLTGKINRILSEINTKEPIRQKLEKIGRSPVRWTARVNQTELLSSLQKIQQNLKKTTQLDDYFEKY